MVFSPGDLIIKEGDLSRDAYFLRRGHVSIFKGKKLVTKFEGGVIGEISLMTEGARSASVVANEFCEAYRLKHQDFEDCLKVAPEDFKSHLKEKMVEGGSFNNRRLSQLSQAEDDPTPPQQRRPAFLRMLTPRSSDSVLTKSQKNLIPAQNWRASFRFIRLAVPRCRTTLLPTAPRECRTAMNPTSFSSRDNLKPRRLTCLRPASSGVAGGSGGGGQAR